MTVWDCEWEKEQKTEAERKEAAHRQDALSSIP